MGLARANVKRWLDWLVIAQKIQRRKLLGAIGNVPAYQDLEFGNDSTHSKPLSHSSFPLKPAPRRAFNDFLYKPVALFYTGPFSDQTYA